MSVLFWSLFWSLNAYCPQNSSESYPNNKLRYYRMTQMDTLTECILYNTITISKKFVYFQRNSVRQHVSGKSISGVCGGAAWLGIDCEGGGQ